jgi:hypothetical protein
VQQQQPYIQFVLLDETDSRATQRLYVKQSVAAPAAQQGGSAMRNRLAVISGCTYFDQRYTLPAVELFPTLPAAGSAVERCGVFVFATVSPTQYALIAVAGIRSELLLAAGPTAGIEIDRTAPAVAGFIAELTSGAWCNRFGYTITALEAAYLQVRHAVYIPDWLR